MPTSLIEKTTLEQIQACCQAIYDKKAEAITVLYLGQKSSITDYFVIANGTSSPHLRALAGEAEKTLKDMDVSTVASDRKPDSGWTVVDAYDFMIHLFTPETRDHYNLEGLWKDAERIQIELK